MRRPTRRARRVEALEGRALAALVFVLNGNAFSKAGPNALTHDAAAVLQDAGERVVQVAYPTIDSAGAFHGLARQIEAESKGRPIGLVGFSAGGSLAARLSEVPSLNVRAVLDDYGPPDLRDWFQFHRGDHFSAYVRGHVAFSPGAVALLSGPSDSSAHVVAAFGLGDHNVAAPESLAGFREDFPGGTAYTYRGGHGASIEASRPALDDFLAHLA